MTLAPADWLAYAGLPRLPVAVIPAELSTVTAAADEVLRVEDIEPWLAHFEFLSSYSRELPRRLPRDSVLLDWRHNLPVRTILVLLRPEADGPTITGTVERVRPGGRSYLTFEYEIVRAWQKPVEEILAGGLSTLPMAPVADVPPAMLPGVIRRMEDRIEQEAPREQAGVLWTAAFVLMGLRYSRVRGGSAAGSASDERFRDVSGDHR